MFLDFWNEIYEYIKRRPQKAILSAIGITWGIFILSLLLGIGNGFEKGVLKMFSGFSRDATYVYALETSVGYKGSSINKKIFFDEMDLNMLKNTISGIISISPEISQWGPVFYEDKDGLFEIKGVSDDYFNIKLMETEKGRTLNQLDIQQNRRTALIGKNVIEILFKNKEPIGKIIQINKELFQIVGIIKNTILNSSEERAIYIPFSTYLTISTENEKFTTFLYAHKKENDAKKIQSNIRNRLARKYQFDSNDDKALYFNSMEDQVKAFSELFSTIRKFLWFMGISTLLGGVIGVGNIMYASTKERTKEFGIRKSIGAKSSEIRGMIIGESVALTTVAGCVGLLLGWGILKIIALLIGEDSPIMEKPTLDFMTTIIAVFILILSGTLAGLAPAIYASDLHPIEALREEN
jgi:putative ABC transport system permease protein